MAQQLWVKTSARIAGPFTASQLRQLAVSGQLSPHHLVSADRQTWTKADRVRGLVFQRQVGAIAAGVEPSRTDADELGLAPIEEESESAAPKWTPVDEAELPNIEPIGETQDGGYRLADLLDEVEPPAEMEEPSPTGTAAVNGFRGSDVDSSSRFASAPGEEVGSVRAPDRKKGFLVGGVAFLVPALFGGITGAVLINASASASDSPSEVGIAFIVTFLVVGVVAGVVAMNGTCSTVSVCSDKPGVVAVSVQRRVAFIPAASFAAQATEKDMLFVTSETRGSGVDKRTIDVAFMILVACLCLVGAVPGILLWMLWWSERKRAEQGFGDVTLLLHPSGKRRGVRLITVYAEGFTTLRLGAPPEIKRCIELFTSRIPIRVLDG